jgi:predicted O-linked N-acetylglucosamine transferase (SPINDLY family)
MLKHADVILDSYPFGGYTTTMEAWAVGSAPIVTLPHEVRSPSAISTLRHLSLADGWSLHGWLL